MRYSELVEYLDNDMTPVIENTMMQIHQQCSEVLAVYKKTGKMLLRGTSRALEPVMKSAPRPKRKPRDTPNSIHLLIDGWLNEHGFTALRSNSTFTSTDDKITRAYGHQYLIFPSNGFAYTWFEKTDDLYGFINEFIESKGLQSFDFADTDYQLRKARQAVRDNINEIMEQAGARNDGLELALQSGHEVMIANCEWWGIDSDYVDLVKKAL